MMDLTKWIPLWEKCPELRPPHVYKETDETENDGWFIGVEQLSHETIAALIRDKAVWWLAKNSAWRSDNLRLGTDSDGRFCVELITHIPYIGEVSMDPTEALYLASCAVLGVDQPRPCQ